jgi:hypothetical protein
VKIPVEAMPIDRMRAPARPLGEPATTVPSFWVLTDASGSVMTQPVRSSSAHEPVARTQQPALLVETGNLHDELLRGRAESKTVAG